MKTCLVAGCERESHSLGMCRMHYMRQRRTGSPDIVRPPGIAGSYRKHALYSAWSGMVNRCHNPKNSSFGQYGGRGITVCKRWRYGESGLTGFECYLADLGERPAGMTLDRIDPLGGYEPTNCRWATSKEQRANISPDGDSRMRQAVRDGVKRYWDARRTAP